MRREFTDVIERALYNGINSGMSLDGQDVLMIAIRWHLISTATLAYRHAADGNIRNPWYDTTCCPPNLERTFASLPGYFYSINSDGVYVHLYDNSEMRWHLENGNGLTIRQTTKYPWEGEVKIDVSPATPGEFAVNVRIPGWSERTRVKVNGVQTGNARPGEYLAIRRRWSAGDTILLSFDMTTRMLKANPAVNEDRGRWHFNAVRSSSAWNISIRLIRSKPRTWLATRRNRQRRQLPGSIRIFLTA